MQEQVQVVAESLAEGNLFAVGKYCSWFVIGVLLGYQMEIGSAFGAGAKEGTMVVALGAGTDFAVKAGEEVLGETGDNDGRWGRWLWCTGFLVGLVLTALMPFWGGREYGIYCVGVKVGKCLRRGILRRFTSETRTLQKDDGKEALLPK